METFCNRKAHSVLLAPVVLQLIFCAGPAAGVEQTAPLPGSSGTTSLGKVNQTFRDVYQDELVKLEHSTFPVIVAVHDQLVLFRGPTQSEGLRYVPEHWHLMKTVNHIPLAVYVLLRNHADGTTLSGPVVERLKQIHEEAIRAGTEVLADKDLSEKLRARQKKIIEQSNDFMRSVLQDKRIYDTQLQGFVDKLVPLSMQNADDAEVLELTELDKVLQKWKSQLSPAQWKRLSVVVLGGHMPRADERRLQYFLKLLNEREEGGRVIYAENVEDNSGALSLLARHNLDRDISRVYFHSDGGMHRDVLGDAARRYLQKHPPNGNR